MAKRKPGLPSSFSMEKIEAEGTGSPVRVGDYLDDDIPSSARKVVPMTHSAPAAREQEPEPAQHREPLHSPEPSPSYHEPPRARTPLPEAPPLRQGYEPAPQNQMRTRAQQKRGRRKQINLFPETKQALDDIIEHVAQYSQQGEPYASEVFYALVSIARESLSQLDLGRVPLRGQHGSKNAQVYRDSLAQAFERAIVSAYQHRRELS